MVGFSGPGSLNLGITDGHTKVRARLRNIWGLEYLLSTQTDAVAAGIIPKDPSQAYNVGACWWIFVDNYEYEYGVQESQTLLQS